MKSLKFSSNQIPQIIAGIQTTTWRLFDDKQLDVGDTLQFINSNSGKTFGYAIIKQIAIKSIKDLDDNDKSGHISYRSNEEMIAAFHIYYGRSVTSSSIVKVVKYKYFENPPPVNVVTKTITETEVKLYTDGGSRGNPGPSSLGYVICSMDNTVVKSNGKYLGITTNNQAEYQAVLQGLKDAKELGAHKVYIYMDSLLVVNQMTGIFKIKNRELWPIHQAIKDQINLFSKVTFTHIPREMNKLADAEVNRILDLQAKDGLASELL